MSNGILAICGGCGRWIFVNDPHCGHCSEKQQKPKPKRQRPQPKQQYSQTGVEKFLAPIADGKIGFFLEIGCWDGESISQTAWLDLCRRWVGVCVDPFPLNFGRRKKRTTVCSRAVTGNDWTKPTRKFTRVSVDKMNRGVVSYLSGFSDQLTAHRQFIDENCRFWDTEVPTITVKDLFSSYPIPCHVEFLSVDTEGSELEIFQSIDFSTYSFSLISFEHNGVKLAQDSIGEILVRNGYVRIHSDKQDDIYKGGT